MISRPYFSWRSTNLIIATVVLMPEHLRGIAKPLGIRYLERFCYICPKLWKHNYRNCSVAAENVGSSICCGAGCDSIARVIDTVIAIVSVDSSVGCGIPSLVVCPALLIGVARVEVEGVAVYANVELAVIALIAVVVV